jgi:hypothetical protein
LGIRNYPEKKNTNSPETHISALSNSPGTETETPTPTPSGTVHMQAGTVRSSLLFIALRGSSGLIGPCSLWLAPVLTAAAAGCLESYRFSK